MRVPRLVVVEAAARKDAQYAARHEEENALLGESPRAVVRLAEPSILPLTRPFLDLGARALRAADLVELALALAAAAALALREAITRPAGRGLGEPAAGRVPDLDVAGPGAPEQGTLELVAGVRDVPVVVDEDRRVVVDPDRERRRRGRRVGGVVEASS